jgi:dipeptidyl aminopeptidase/acylaminoacyl peptidase
MVFTFDFSGSGNSDGPMPSLGYHERDDISIVVQYLLDCPIVSSIGLWGRSMGAVAALLYTADDPTISFVVADSPFSSLKTLALDIMTGPFHLPETIANYLLAKLTRVL